MRQFGPNCLISAGKTSGKTVLLSAGFFRQHRGYAVAVEHFMTMKR